MKNLIVMGLRTVANLDAKEQLYLQIDSDSIRAKPRFNAEHLDILSGVFALGILSSHSVLRIQAVITHLDWTHYFPIEHVISSDGLDRKDSKNWAMWRSQYRQRGLEVHIVVDVGEALLRNLASDRSFSSINKYYVTNETQATINGVVCISSLDQMVEYSRPCEPHG